MTKACCNSHTNYVTNVCHNAGVRQAQGPHDAGRHPHGGLPARRPPPQLLPQHHLVRRRLRTGRRLPAGRDGPPRTRHRGRLNSLVPTLF